MNAIDEEEYDDDGDVDVEAAADIKLSLCNNALASDGVTSNGVTLNNEFNNVDDACNSDVDMAEVAICNADEGKPINGT